MHEGPRISRDEWAMRLAIVTSARSTCLRRAVGCVLLDRDGHVLATGYNGVAKGRPHCNEPDKVDISDHTQLFSKSVYSGACAGAEAPSGTALDSCEAIHAEQNALLQCRDVREISVCYVTCSPCVTCAKLLLNTGCERIVWSQEYPHRAAAVLWLASGRAWDKHSEGGSWDEGQ